MSSVGPVVFVIWSMFWLSIFLFFVFLFLFLVDGFWIYVHRATTGGEGRGTINSRSHHLGGHVGVPYFRLGTRGLDP